MDYDERYEIKNKEIQDKLKFISNDIVELLPEGWGFMLMIFSFGENGSNFYMSNGIREDVIKAMKEFIERAEKEQGND